ncbi:MAG TPA: hypothetical protein VM487_19140 [Phycisphaerae bacterium]|nr:hypothetical protein [Phycisphaerae bacterium]
MPLSRDALDALSTTDLKEQAKTVKVKGYTKMSKAKLVDALDGKTLGDSIPPPTMSQIDEVIAWLVRELIGRPTQR